MDCYKYDGRGLIVCGQTASEWRYSDNICRNHASHCFAPHIRTVTGPRAVVDDVHHQRRPAHSAPLCARCRAAFARQGALPQGRYAGRAACASMAAAHFLEAGRNPAQHCRRQLHRAAIACTLGAGRHAAQHHAHRRRRVTHRVSTCLARADLGEVRGTGDQPAAARVDAGARHHARWPAARRCRSRTARTHDRAAADQRTRTRDANPDRRSAAQRQATAPALRDAAAESGRPRNAGRTGCSHRRQRTHRGATLSGSARSSGDNKP